MNFHRMPIEIESPEELGYAAIRFNLAESSVRDRTLGELQLPPLNELVLAYGEHRGDTALRQAIVADSQLQADHVLTTTGAAMALFLVHATLLDSAAHLVVIRPNYGTNLETPRALGCAMTVLDLEFKNGFHLDSQRLAAAIRSETRLISLTNPHNPTGKIFPRATLEAAAALAEKQGCYLLVDETYRDLDFRNPKHGWAAEISPCVISIASLSKAYGVPGIRTGWLICRDFALLERLLAAKEQVAIGGSVLDEAVALEVLRQRLTWLPAMHAGLRQNFSILKKFLDDHALLEWVEPDAGAVCFPRLRNPQGFDFQLFKKEIFEKFQTVVGFGHWFERPERYFRLGFGYPTAEELTEGLARFEACLKSSSIG